MNFREYKNEIENFSQNSTKISENLTKTKHKMFMKGKNLKRQFRKKIKRVMALLHTNLRATHHKVLIIILKDDVFQNIIY